MNALTYSLLSLYAQAAAPFGSPQSTQLSGCLQTIHDRHHDIHQHDVETL